MLIQYEDADLLGVYIKHHKNNIDRPHKNRTLDNLLNNKVEKKYINQLLSISDDMIDQLKKAWVRYLSKSKLTRDDAKEVVQRYLSVETLTVNDAISDPYEFYQSNQNNSKTLIQWAAETSNMELVRVLLLHPQIEVDLTKPLGGTDEFQFSRAGENSQSIKYEFMMTYKAHQLMKSESPALEIARLVFNNLSELRGGLSHESERLDKVKTTLNEYWYVVPDLTKRPIIEAGTKLTQFLQSILTEARFSWWQKRQCTAALKEFSKEQSEVLVEFINSLRCCDNVNDIFTKKQLGLLIEAIESYCRDANVLDVWKEFGFKQEQWKIFCSQYKQSSSSARYASSGVTVFAKKDESQHLLAGTIQSDAVEMESEKGFLPSP